MKSTFYRLSEKACALPWAKWLSERGCGLTHIGSCIVSETLGPESRWAKNGVTLGQIAQADAASGRHLARYAREHLGRDDLVEAYELVVMACPKERPWQTKEAI